MSTKLCHGVAKGPRKVTVQRKNWPQDDIFGFEHVYLELMFCSVFAYPVTYVYSCPPCPPVPRDRKTEVECAGVLLCTSVRPVHLYYGTQGQKWGVLDTIVYFSLSKDSIFLHLGYTVNISVEHSNYLISF